MKNTTKLQKGFTLIELLIVIAIIGILAAIVFASIRGPIDQAKDTKIKSQLSQLQTQSVIYYSENEGEFGGDDLDGYTDGNGKLSDCTADGASEHDSDSFVDSRAAQLLLKATEDTSGEVVCLVTKKYWAVYAPLTEMTDEDDPQYYCVNHLGESRVVLDPPTGGDNEDDFLCEEGTSANPTP